MTALDRGASHALLLDLVERHHGDVPCRRGDVLPVGYWTDDDATRQGVAALACRHCPIKAACRQYGETYPQELGVYGARTEGQRHHTTTRSTS